MPLPVPAPIDTARLVVRRFDDTDLAGLMPLNSDPRVTRFLPYGPWQSPDDAHAWLARSRTQTESGRGLQFVIVDKATAALVGTCLLFRHEEPHASAELGYALGHAFWGQGMMHEALVGLISCAFGAWGLRRLEAQVNTANAASNRVLARLGFVQEGVLRQRFVSNGMPYDVQFHGLLKQEWDGAAG